MRWIEEDHPRDEDGKFTFKNGGMTKQEETKEEFKNTLFSNTRKQEKEKEEIKRRKNELLNILGDRATNADILYGTPESLEKKINEMGLRKKGILTGGASTVNNTGNVQNWERPVNYTKINSPFSPNRYHPVEHKYKKHDGVDLKVVQGTVVKAFSSGEVEFAGTMKGYGYVIVINHGNWNGKNIRTKYAHLSKFNVKKGDTIGIGANIGLSGGKPGTAGAGVSTGPHLHFEVLENNIPVDPMKYLK